MMIYDIIQKSFLDYGIFGLWVINVTEYQAILLLPVHHNFVNVF